MYDFVIIHGSFGSPFENWTPWLFNALIKKGKKVLVPQLPTINQNFQNWEKTLDSYSQFIDVNTSFIAHSLGPAFVVDYLIKNKIKIKNLYFVAPFYGFINIKEFDDVNKTFFFLSDLSLCKSYFENAICLYSDDDPYVPFDMSRDFSDKLTAEKIIISGGKHLNASAGFIEFAELLREIETNDF